jgi:hypothetical protein
MHTTEKRTNDRKENADDNINEGRSLLPSTNDKSKGDIKRTMNERQIK